MINVTSEVVFWDKGDNFDDIESPRSVKIVKIRNHVQNSEAITLELNGRLYSVLGKELKVAIDNALNSDFDSVSGFYK